MQTSKLDHFPRDRGENNKYLKPPPRVLKTLGPFHYTGWLIQICLRFLTYNLVTGKNTPPRKQTTPVFTGYHWLKWLKKTAAKFTHKNLVEDDVFAPPLRRFHNNDWFRLWKSRAWYLGPRADDVSIIGTSLVQGRHHPIKNKWSQVDRHEEVLMICSFVLGFFPWPTMQHTGWILNKKKGDNLQRFETKVHAAKVVFENWMPKSWSWEKPRILRTSSVSLVGKLFSETSDHVQWSFLVPLMGGRGVYNHPIGNIYHMFFINMFLKNYSTSSLCCLKDLKFVLDLQIEISQKLINMFGSDSTICSLEDHPI